MKKVFILICMFMILATNCFANKQEYIDKKYDFTQPKKILVVSSMNENIKNGIIEYRINEIFTKTFTSKFIKPLKSNGFEISHEVGDFLNGKDMVYKLTSEPKLAEWKSTYDIIIFNQLTEFTTKTGWVDGYTYTVPETHYYSSFDINGNIHSGTVTTQSTKYVPGYNAEFAVEKVRFDIYDLKTDKIVWSRIDSREKDSKQGNLYERILKSFFGDYKDRAIIVAAE